MHPAVSMSNNPERIADLFSLHVDFLIFNGDLPLECCHRITKYIGNWPRLAAALTYFYSAYNVFLSVHIMLLFMIKVYLLWLHDSELEALTESIAITIIFTFASFTTIYWFWLSSRLHALLQSINEHYWMESLPAGSYVSIHAAYERTRRYTIWWQIICIGGTLLWAFAPLITLSRELPLDCWYPFDVKPIIRYALLYMIQVHAQINMGSVFASSGSLLFSIIIILLAQYDALYCSVKHLYSNALLRSGLHNDETAIEWEKANDEEKEVNEYMFSTECKMDPKRLAHLRNKYAHQAPVPNLERALHESLDDCVRLHIFLLESCSELKELFNPVCLFKSLLTTLQLCTLTFRAVEGSLTILSAINLAQYVVLIYIELMLYNYCGEMLSNHSIRSAEALGRAPWWKFASTLRTELSIFLINSQQPATLSAGKFYAMNVERLRLVSMQALSFLTLLQNLDEKRD